MSFAKLHHFFFGLNVLNSIAYTDTVSKQIRSDTTTGNTTTTGLSNQFD